MPIFTVHMRSILAWTFKRGASQDGEPGRESGKFSGVNDRAGWLWSEVRGTRECCRLASRNASPLKRASAWR